MGLLLSNVLSKKPTPSNGVESLLDFGGGTLFGIFVNDTLEYIQKNVVHSPWPTIFSFKSPAGNWNVGIGVDDIVEVLIGLVTAASFPRNKWFGFGMVAGTVATKLGETYGTKISFFGGMAAANSAGATMPGVFSGGNFATASVDSNNQYLQNTAPIMVGVTTAMHADHKPYSFFGSEDNKAGAGMNIALP